jgi:hypothetical protein
MGIGIEILNIDGHIQITDKFRNLMLINKGTFVLEEIGNTGSGFGHHALTLSDNEYFVAFRCNNSSHNVGVIGSTHLSGYPRTTVFYGTAGATITYYTFGYPIQASGGNSYLEVYNEYGGVVFSAINSKRYMKVVSTLSGTCTESQLTNLSTINTTTVSDSITPAILTGICSYRLLHDVTFLYNIILEQNFNGSVVTTKACVISAGGQPGGQLQQRFQPNYNFLILDVTDL